MNSLHIKTPDLVIFGLTTVSSSINLAHLTLFEVIINLFPDSINSLAI